MEITLIKKRDERIDRKTGKPIERLRVVAYARVSTDNDEQLNSYESQKKYYKEKIISNEDWSYQGIYADEGISGTQDFKRENFMKMIEDALNSKFDLVLTKSISRFARNTLDTLKYVRLLKEKNIAILFEEENINTLEMSGELLLTVLSSVAQQESETISSHVKLGLKMKSERGELVGFNNCFGYSYDSKTNTMSIVEEEAELVKFMFKTYLEGHGADFIAKKLTEMGVSTRRNRGKWSATTVMGILKNEKYIGDVLQGKTFTTDPITHKRLVNCGESDQYYMKNHHEAIISREDYDKVQEILKERCGARATGRRLGNIGRKYPFSGKMKCGFCGATYVRRCMYSKKGSTVIWDCLTNIETGKDSCKDSKAMRENLVENAFVDAYQKLCSRKDFNSEDLLQTITNCMKDGSVEEKLKVAKKNKAKYETQIHKLVDLMLEGTIDKDLFETKKEKYERKLENTIKEIEQYELLCEDDEKIETGINKIKNALNSKEILEGFDRDVFDALVDYIIIGGYDDSGKKDENMIRFVCKTKFNETFRCDLTKENILNNNNLVDNDGKFINVLDFYSNQEYYLFYKDEDGKMHKELKNKVRVRVEVEN